MLPSSSEREHRAEPLDQLQEVWRRGSELCRCFHKPQLSPSRAALAVRTLLSARLGFAARRVFGALFLGISPCRVGGSSWGCQQRVEKAAAPRWDAGAAPDAVAPCFIPVSLWVVGGDAQPCLRGCFLSRDEEADLHLCQIIRRAGRIVHVTSSRGEPRFSTPSCCSGAGISLAGKAEWSSGEAGQGDDELPRAQLPPAPTVSR